MNAIRPVGRRTLAAGIAFAVMILFQVTARADDATHFGVAATAGLSGFGLDLGVNANSYFGFRATAAEYSLTHDGSYSTSVAWNAKLKLQQVGLLADLYPFQGVFHLSAGVVKDDTHLDMTAAPTGSGSLTFNGDQYPTNELTGAQGSVSWNKTVPYVGLGWGNLAGSRGFHFTTDFGVLLSGSPTASLNAQCLPGSSCPQATLNVDLAAEQSKLQNDVNRLKVWPVARLGIGYAF